MFDEFTTNLLIFISGLGSGLFVSIASGTAGAIMLPSITVIAGYTIYQAIGTSLAIDFSIGVVASIIFFKKGNINFDRIFILIVLGSIFSFIGSHYTSIARESSLNLIIGIFLLLLGLNFIKNGIQKNIEMFDSRLDFTFFRERKMLTFVILGVLLGLGSGLIGMGTAGFVAVVLVLVYRYDVVTGIGTALFSSIFIAGSGAFGHSMNNEFVMNPFLIAVFGAVLGAACGSFFANEVNEEKLGRIIGVIVTIFGVVFLFKAFI